MLEERSKNLKVTDALESVKKTDIGIDELVNKVTSQMDSDKAGKLSQVNPIVGPKVATPTPRLSPMLSTSTVPLSTALGSAMGSTMAVTRNPLTGQP